MRLLIVEDELRIAELVKGALARVGFAVDVVTLCADARAAFAGYILMMRRLLILVCLMATGSACSGSCEPAET